jgi:hypothetical protein
VKGRFASELIINSGGVGSIASLDAWCSIVVDIVRSRSPLAHKTGPSIAMALFQSRRVIGQCATISAVTSCDWAKYSS